MSPKKTIAIIGASADRGKFGNQAVRTYLQQGYDVYPVNNHEPEIEGLKAYASIGEVLVERLHRISLYLPSHIGIHLLEEIAAKPHDEFWINPGAESSLLLKRAEELGLEPILACSIVGAYG